MPRHNSYRVKGELGIRWERPLKKSSVMGDKRKAARHICSDCLGGDYCDNPRCQWRQHARNK